MDGVALGAGDEAGGAPGAGARVGVSGGGTVVVVGAGAVVEVDGVVAPGSPERVPHNGNSESRLTFCLAWLSGTLGLLARTVFWLGCDRSLTGSDVHESGGDPASAKVMVGASALRSLTQVVRLTEFSDTPRIDPCMPR